MPHELYVECTGTVVRVGREGWFGLSTYIFGRTSGQVTESLTYIMSVFNPRH